ncbi:MAG: bacteriochlorophyll 4-vinyl reductase [Acidocella sp.]|nr:bacteriochlorophyll 4-vinyl reductase [Acidocella sp.]
MHSTNAGKIGPNAVIQLLLVLQASGLHDVSSSIFTKAGLAGWLTHPPTAMVDEHKAALLHNMLRSTVPPAMAEALLAAAGKRTADYLLAYRIPRLVQFSLKLLPSNIAAKILVSAIRNNAWTFVGSGIFTARTGRPLSFEIADNPLCTNKSSTVPLCSWHVAVFQRLFEVLVSPATHVMETDCKSCGGRYCRFVIRW